MDFKRDYPDYLEYRLINYDLNSNKHRGNIVSGPIVVINKNHPNAELHINPDLTFTDGIFTIHPETTPYIKRVAA